MSNTITACACGVSPVYAKGMCNRCYKRERYHLTKNSEVLARRAASTASYREKAKAAGTYSETIRRNNLRQYGLTPEQYDEMNERQHGLCVICGNPEGTGKRLAVDHCHTTGKVRGLLCTNCNQALGKFKDDIRLMARAIAYLSGGGLQ